MRWSENHALFEQELKKGHKWQTIVAQRMSDAGLDVVCSEIMPVEYTTNKSYNHPEDKDIIVPPDFVIEVKSRNLRFNGPHDFPFDTAIMDTVRGWNQKEPEPRAVVLISQITGEIVCVNVRESKGSWFSRQIYDSVRGIKDDTYLCPVRFLREFDELIEWLKTNYNLMEEN